MVGMACTLWVAALTCMIAGGDTATSMVESVVVSSPGTVHIKPCQPVCVVLEVKHTPEASGAAIGTIVHELTQSVRVHGPTAETSCTEAGCGFVYADERSVRKQGAVPGSCTVVCIVYWNAQGETYVFDGPGAYRVEFGAWAAFDVIVDEPTEAERALAGRLRAGGEALGMCAFGSTDNRCLEWIPQIEQLLCDHPDTAYTPALSVVLGWGKLRMIVQEASARQESDLAKLTGERMACAHKYIEPYCRGELDSLLKVGAAYQLAEVMQERIQSLDKTDRAAADKLRNEARELLQKVKDSPYAVELVRNVDSALKRLDEQEQQKDKGNEK